MITHALTAHDPAGHAVANERYMSSNRPPANQVIKSCHAVEICDRKAEQIGKVPQAFIRHPALVPVNDQHCIDANGLPGWILREFFFNLPSFFGCQHASSLVHRSMSAS